MTLPDPPVEIEFRDGIRSVPPHVASNIAISGIDPATVTFEEAVEISNTAMLRNFINNAGSTMIHRHFVDHR